MNDTLEFQYHVKQDVVVANLGSVHPMIESDVAVTMEEQIKTLLDDHPGKSLLLDFSQVKFFGSALIESMIRIFKEIGQKTNTQFALCNLQEFCREVLEVTKLDEVWPVFNDEQSAMNALQNS